jgi:diamine N-acetyltransferase
VNESVTLEPLTEPDIHVIAPLAARIWRLHYTPIVGAEQVEYMLQRRYGAEDLNASINATDRWFEVLRVSDKICGFLRCTQKSDVEMKLEELYLLDSQRGQGFGKRMLERAETIARDQGCQRLTLTVNKHNAPSIAVYLHQGFVNARSVVFDIGNGFVMDDFVMEKEIKPDRGQPSK